MDAPAGGSIDGGPARDDPRFARPPDGTSADGQLRAGAGRDVTLPRRIQSIFVGMSVAWACVAVPGVPIAVAWGAAIVLAIVWSRATRARTPPRTIEWDAWGVSEKVRGAYTAIAWAGARAWVSRDAQRLIAQIVDESGRSIVCAAGTDLPDWATGSVAARADVERLIEAVGTLPRADAPPLDVPALRHAGVVASSVLTAIAIAIGGGHLGSGIAAMAVLAIAIAPDVPRARDLARRAREMRGARTVPIAGELALARPGGGTIPIVVDEAPRDARIARRDEAVRLMLDDASGEDPYRMRAQAHATRIESLRDRAARIREVLWIATRAALVTSAFCAVVVVPALVVPYAAPRVESFGLRRSGPRPPQPTAWRSAPRVPILRRGARATCEDGPTSCYPAITYYDEVGREVYRCGGWQIEACDRELRARMPQVDLRED